MSSSLVAYLIKKRKYIDKKKGDVKWNHTDVKQKKPLGYNMFVWWLLCWQSDKKHSKVKLNMIICIMEETWNQFL